jgi:hypothetical protein
MKTRHLNIGKVFFKMILSTMILATIGCSKEEETPEVQNESISFRVQLEKIVATEIKEAEGDALEVYGSIDGKLQRGNVTEVNNLWIASPTEAIDVTMSDFPLTSSVVYEVMADAVSSSSLEVTVDLYDYDFGANDDEDLGRESINVPLNTISDTSTFQIILDDSTGQFVQVTYSIRKL